MADVHYPAPGLVLEVPACHFLALIDRPGLRPLEDTLYFRVVELSDSLIINKSEARRTFTCWEKYTLTL